MNLGRRESVVLLAGTQEKGQTRLRSQTRFACISPFFAQFFCLDFFNGPTVPFLLSFLFLRFGRFKLYCSGGW